MKNFGIWLIRIALVLFVLGLFFGHLASESYRITQPKSGVMGFLSLRPLHVSSAYLGIITAGLGFLTLIIAKMKTTRFGTFLQYLHFSLPFYFERQNIYFLYMHKSQTHVLSFFLPITF